MPKWDFHCDTCDRTFELAFRNHKESEDATCPNCKQPISRQPAAPNFVVTGYRAATGYFSKT